MLLNGTLKRTCSFPFTIQGRWSRVLFMSIVKVNLTIKYHNCEPSHQIPYIGNSLPRKIIFFQLNPFLLFRSEQRLLYISQFEIIAIISKLTKVPCLYVSFFVFFFQTDFPNHFLFNCLFFFMTRKSTFSIFFLTEMW